MSPPQRRIGVLQVLDALRIGGAEQLVLTLAKHLDRTRFNLVVCTLFSRDPNVPEPLADEIRALGIRVEMLGMTTWRDWETVRAFWSLMGEEHIDIVHGHMVPADFWACLLGKVLFRCRTRKTVYTKHSQLPPGNTADRLQQAVLNLGLADRIVSISRVVTRHLVTRCHAHSRRVVEICNPVDTQAFAPSVSGQAVRSELAIPQDAVVVGNTSRFEARKGYDCFLQIASKVVAARPHVRFLGVGHGPGERRLRAQIRSLGLAEHVILTGPRRDIPQVLAAMDVFLFTSLWGEGFGIALLEAMAAAKPIVATNTGAAPELIEHGVSGFLPSPKAWVPQTCHLDIGPMVEKVGLLIENPSLRRTLGDAARQKAVQEFGVDVFVNRTQRLYESLVR